MPMFNLNAVLHVIREVEMGATKHFNPTAVYLHGGPANLDGNVLKRHGNKGHDMGGLFFVQDSPEGRKLAYRYAVGRYGENGAVYSVRINLHGDEVLDLSNKKHLDRLQSELSPEEYNQIMSTSNGGQMDWSVVDDELMGDLGFKGVIIGEPPFDGGGVIYSIGLFDANDVEMIGNKSVEEFKNTVNEDNNVYTIPDVRPPKENVQDVVNSQFNFGRIVGNSVKSVKSLRGGTVGAQDDQTRVDELKKALSSPNGYFERIIVDTQGNVIEGQHRYDAAKALGMKTVPVVVIEDLSLRYKIDDVIKLLASKFGVKSDQARQVVMQSIDAIEETGSPEKALEEYEWPGKWNTVFTTVINVLGSQVVGEDSLDTVHTLTPEQIAKKHNVPVSKIMAELKKGIEVEREHTTVAKDAREIALDHLSEMPDYYTKLATIDPHDLKETSTTRLVEFGTVHNFDPKVSDVISRMEMAAKNGTLDDGALKQFASWFKDHNMEYVRLYHGTDISNKNSIVSKGILPTSEARRRSLQSGSGYVYLTYDPGRALAFAKLAYPQADGYIVYQADVLVKRLLPDMDQLANMRMVNTSAINDTLADSFVWGGGTRVRGKIDTNVLSIFNEYDKNGNVINESNTGHLINQWLFEDDVDEFSLQDRLDDATTVDDIKEILSSLNARHVTLPNHPDLYLVGDYVIEWSGEDTYAGVERKDHWIYDVDVLSIFSDEEDKINASFWNSPKPLYHGTESENVKSIMANGLSTSNTTRGMTNRNVGLAVFTSMDRDEIESYYPDVFAINTVKMISDGYKPYITREPNIVETNLRQRLATMIDLDIDFDIENGMSPNTIIIHGEVPAKYLTRLNGSTRNTSINEGYADFIPVLEDVAKVLMRSSGKSLSRFEPTTVEFTKNLAGLIQEKHNDPKSKAILDWLLDMKLMVRFNRMTNDETNGFFTHRNDRGAIMVYVGNLVPSDIDIKTDLPFDYWSKNMNVANTLLHELRHGMQISDFPSYYNRRTGDLAHNRSNYDAEPIEIDASFTEFLSELYNPTMSIQRFVDQVMKSLNSIKKLTPKQQEHYRRSAAKFYTIRKQKNESHVLESVGSDKFNAWFSGSKIVNSDGSPKKVYHGSPDIRGILDQGFQPQFNGNFYFFTDEYSVAKTYTDEHRAFDYQNAEGNVVGAYLRMKNPLVINGNHGHWRDVQAQAKAAVNDGYDGVIIKNIKDEYGTHKGSGKSSTVYIVYNPHQIYVPKDKPMISRHDRRELPITHKHPEIDENDN